MGVVYKGIHRDLGRPIAIKVLKQSSPEDLARFAREARLLSRLSHPNIVQVFDAGRDGDLAYLVCEWVEGETLASRIGRGSPSPDQSVEWLRQLARALGHAHGRGVVHRDVKPDNVFVPKDGALKLGDFGLARDQSANANLTATGVIMGTPAYMAPEQVKGIKLGPATDQYALGIVAYELLSGRTPFIGEDPLDLAIARLREPPEPLRHLAPGVPEGLAAIVMRMLALEPALRFPSMETVETELSTLVPGTEPARRRSQITVALPSLRSTGPMATRSMSMRHEAEKGRSPPHGAGRSRIVACAVLGAMGLALALALAHRGRSPGVPPVSPGALVGRPSPTPSPPLEALIDDAAKGLFEATELAMQPLLRGRHSDEVLRDFVQRAQRYEARLRPLAPALAARMADPSAPWEFQHKVYKHLLPLRLLDRLRRAADRERKHRNRTRLAWIKEIAAWGDWDRCLGPNLTPSVHGTDENEEPHGLWWPATKKSEVLISGGLEAARLTGELGATHVQLVNRPPALRLLWRAPLLAGHRPALAIQLSNQLDQCHVFVVNLGDLTLLVYAPEGDSRQWHQLRHGLNGHWLARQERRAIPITISLLNLPSTPFGTYFPFAMKVHIAEASLPSPGLR